MTSYANTISSVNRGEGLQTPEVLMSERAVRRTDERRAPSVPKAIRCQVTYLDDWARVTATGWLDVAGAREIFTHESVWSAYPSPDPQC